MDILIIDDDAVDRMASIRTLKNAGLNIRSIDQAETGTEGIQKALSKHYDTILLDYQIPPSNGIEALREIRGSCGNSTAIVMLSHSNDEKLALSCIEAGAQDFIMKSEVSISRLKRAILIAAERNALEKQIETRNNQLRELAERDTLTGLRNRYVFDTSLNDEFERAKRNTSQLALLILDVDDFKRVNDLLGHQAGDDFLKHVARRLEGVTRGSDTLCRLGGDEFAILVTDLPKLENVKALSDRILEAMAPPVNLGTHSIPITMSIGIASYPHCASSAMELMKCADVAMYRSKELGKNQVQYYTHDFHANMQQRMQLENELKLAIKRDELRLFYQPQVDATTGALAGVEAFICWQNERRGLLAPDDFIPLAEESLLIIDIGRWVINEACQQFSTWNKLYDLKNMTFTIAVNISAKQFKDHGLFDYLRACIKSNEIDAQLIELEFTESSLESSLDAIDMLNKLSDIGVKLALDDFGVGYSSLSQLKKFPFDVLKIDKSFVQDPRDNGNGLLAAICAFAHSLGYETVAEGIETEEQKLLCQTLNVNRLRGYLFDKPMTAKELQKSWLTHLLKYFTV
ncbi:two-component system response regulator [Marinomonas fungiae]|uniref:Diguanylate cyclase (GGDEF) domain n=1 Tax=Marinomonas fungiae TaxID=1137284 RepID=A0A0K6IUA9_9GAMM|nr:GGDEF domain-containing response regulator [Marinomonas fungiae]CUB06690.1 diguanylate cyclase (GGDEF) domain [Marinomonas fungiae]